MPFLRYSAAAILLTVCLPAMVQADLVVFYFQGTVTSATGVFVGQGSVISGSFAYDDGLTDEADTDTGYDRFTSASNPFADWHITVEVGAVSRTTDDNTKLNGVSESHHLLEVVDRVDADIFKMVANRPFGGLTDDKAEIHLRDDDFPPDGVAVGSNNLNHTPLLVPVNPLLFNKQFNFYESWNGGPAAEGTVEFTINSISLQSVPEPTHFLFAAIVSIGFFSRRRRS